MKNMRK